MEPILIIVFVVGYLAIALEHTFHIDKAAPAILTAVALWTIYVFNVSEHELHDLIHHILVGTLLGEVASILFFLIGAMAIVELIDAHGGFEVITNRVTTQNPTVLLWIITIITFFCSAILDNLTTSIVMVSIMRKLTKDRQARIYYLSLVVIAANAGGAWTAIGDVTTTMLWIGGQISAGSIMGALFLPSVACAVVPVVLMSVFYQKSLTIKVSTEEILSEDHLHSYVSTFERQLVFFLGVGGLISVPVFKSITHLPPFMGMMLAVGAIWLITDKLHRHKSETERRSLSMYTALKRVDVPSVIFFLGILLAIGCLGQVGILQKLAQNLDASIGNVYVISIVIGLLSAMIDNVPLVAAAQKMYELVPADKIAEATIKAKYFAMDGVFWEFLAYCAGTGGSCLIIGSAAGVAIMGLERIDFIWYLKRISWIALLGYLAGAAVYILQPW